MAADGSRAAAAEDRACAVSTRAEVEEALDQNALVMARLQRELDRRKSTELFLKRRLRRFDMDDFEKAWGTEPGGPNDVGGGSDEDDDAGAASSGTMGAAQARQALEAGSAGGRSPFAVRVSTWTRLVTRTAARTCASLHAALGHASQQQRSRGRTRMRRSRRATRCRLMRSWGRAAGRGVTPAAARCLGRFACK